ncbi:MAG: hypothetical protein A3E87_00255 [Gammaproteobacteria bacterium RIFCSPHIGHO2_12_FULL_35_23]|nr:MAG: hypothetical protein A3E87_00255 [Gammaproteobacteria bacterium RIFCSPHIGHO2_12_FULL_35_23]
MPDKTSLQTHLIPLIQQSLNHYHRKKGIFSKLFGESREISKLKILNKKLIALATINDQITPELLFELTDLLLNAYESNARTKEEEGENLFKPKEIKTWQDFNWLVKTTSFKAKNKEDTIADPFPKLITFFYKTFIKDPPLSPENPDSFSCNDIRNITLLFRILQTLKHANLWQNNQQFIRNFFKPDTIKNILKLGRCSGVMIKEDQKVLGYKISDVIRISAGTHPESQDFGILPTSHAVTNRKAITPLIIAIDYQMQNCGKEKSLALQSLRAMLSGDAMIDRQESRISVYDLIKCWLNLTTNNRTNREIINTHRIGFFGKTETAQFIKRMCYSYGSLSLTLEAQRAYYGIPDKISLSAATARVPFEIEYRSA